MTAVVWIVLDQVARRGADAAADGLVARIRTWVRERLCRSRKPQRTLATPLNPNQLARIRELIVERATGRDIAEPEAEVLADAVVARLAVIDPSADATRPDGTS